MLAGNLKDNEIIFILPEMQMRKLNIFTCIQMCTTGSCGFLTSQPFEIQSENRKWIIQHNLERVFLRRVTVISAALHKEPCLGGQRLWGSFVVLSLFIYFGVWRGLFGSAVKQITQTIRLFENFYFLSPRLKSRKLNGTQFLQTGEIVFLILRSWNILVAFSH